MPTRRRIVLVTLLAFAALAIAVEVVIDPPLRLLGSIAIGQRTLACGEVGERREEVRIPVDGLELAATLATRERPRGRAIMVHGAARRGRHHRTARFLSRILDDLGFDVLAPDLRGWGESPFPPPPHDATSFDFGRDVAAAVSWWNERRPGAPPPLLVGHSLGGGAVLRAEAAGARVRGVVAAGTPFHESAFREDPGLAERRSRSLLEGMGLEATPDRVDAIAAALLEIDPSRIEGDRPRLLVYGELEDDAAAGRSAAERAAQRLVLVPGVAHHYGTGPTLGGCDVYPREARDHLRAAIEEWLDGLPDH